MRYIIKDTRQQEGKHDKKHNQILSCGIKLLTASMPCGDYCVFDNLTEETQKKIFILSDQYERGLDPKPSLRKEVSDLLLSEIKVSVDTKQNLDELSRNLLNRSDHSRFWKEIRRAKERNIHLIILCEHSANIKSIPDVGKWTSYYSKISGRAVMEEMYRAHISYGVDFLFCSKSETGKRIIELLGGG